MTVSKPDDGKDDPKDDDAAKKAGYLWLYFNASDYEKHGLPADLALGYQVR